LEGKIQIVELPKDFNLSRAFHPWGARGKRNGKRQKDGT